jgi:hypothetical protein
VSENVSFETVPAKNRDSFFVPVTRMSFSFYIHFSVVKFHGWVKDGSKKNVNKVNLNWNTKEKSRQAAGPYYKEFSHVNGPKDQAGGCLADLLFYFMWQIY